MYFGGVIRKAKFLSILRQPRTNMERVLPIGPVINIWRFIPMPMYDYSCKKCEENFEALQKVTDEPLTECEKCAGPVEKIFNKMTFHLYGPGFYTTDNKRKYLK